MKKVSLLLVLVAAYLSGCATQPPSSEVVKIAPSERLYDQSLLKPEGQRNIPVKITRDSGIKGILSTAFLKIDGKYVTWFNVSEEVTIYLSEGGYVFELLISSCPDSPICINTSDITIKSGFDNNFRIKMEQNFELVRTKT